MVRTTKLTVLFAAVIASSLFILSCGGEENTDLEIETNVDEIQVDQDKFLDELSELEAQIDGAQGAPAEEDLKKAIVMYQDYAVIFPESKDAPDYLLKASDFALFTNQAYKSVKLLTRIEEEFPNYERMEDVMYNKASHLDFEMRDTTSAKEAYQTFIEAYPNSELVDDAKSRIENIQYSMEELTEKFLKDLEENGPNLP